jgi:hypothetical protein
MRPIGGMKSGGQEQVDPGRRSRFCHAIGWCVFMRADHLFDRKAQSFRSTTILIKSVPDELADRTKRSSNIF